MQIHFGMRFVLVILALSLAACRLANVEEVSESNVETALFEEFETVYYVKANLLPGFRASEHLSGRDRAEILRPLWFVRAAMDSIDWNLSESVWGNSEAIMLGARDFRPPEGLGMVRGTYCYVLVPRSGSRLELRRHLQSSPQRIIAGAPVWNRSAMLREFGVQDPRTSSLFLTQTPSGLILLSNDSKALSGVLERLTTQQMKPSAASSAQDDLTSTKRYAVWGIRRFRHLGVVDKIAAGMTDVDSKAEALKFYVDVNQNTATIILVDSTKEGRTATKLNSRSVSLQLSPKLHGEWETSFVLSGGEESFKRINILLALLGFGIYV